ncbi:hypothetical protein [Natronorubrum halophilum]|uniref:hypothetical protein n=1 Tax=Natronorubrum halophilum TaxID=1702106 RepID=UPI0010C1A585|nr:hypothetical protein [Natronorubrum halophilum]
MRALHSRRGLLISAIPFAVALTGCSESQQTSDDEPSEPELLSADAYDCTDVERPDPDPPSVDDALEPAAYPSPPDSLPAGAGEYAITFEEAYRKNAFLEEYGSETQAFDFQFQTRQMTELESADDRNGALVSIVYNMSASTQQGATSEEWDTRVTYYLDENIVLRARYNGIADGPSFEPDPRTAGEPVACFERRTQGNDPSS